MKKNLIIGNGFDLRHFLPTKYNHFICLLREIESKKIDSNLNFDELFSNEFYKYDPKFHEKIVEFYDTDKLIFIQDDLKNIKNKLEKNIWYKHFKSIEDSHIETWIDFETEINRVLENIVELFEKLDKRIKDSNNRFQGHFYSDSRFNSSDCFESKLSKILLTNLDIFLFIDSNRYGLNDQYYFKIDNEIQLLHKNKILNNLYNSLQEFTGIFNDFFLSVIDKFYNFFRYDKKENFSNFSKTSLLSSIDKVYSFNYTKTVDEFYSHKKIEFLHGNVLKKWKDTSDLKIVLGVDDLNENLKKHKLFNFTKYFQKLHKGTDYQFLHNIEDQTAHTFYFWGHSLDISDKEYIIEVFHQLKKEKSRIHHRFVDSSRIVIFYLSISSKADLLNNLLSIIGKEEIEKLMKQKKLTFIQATDNNLFKVLNN